MSEEEMARLGDVLFVVENGGSESPFVIAAIGLPIFTGTRSGEILGRRRELVHLDRSMLLLPDSKSGQKAICLSVPAQEILANLPHVEGNSHVICGDESGAEIVNLQKPWRRIRAKAGLEDVRLWLWAGSFG